MSDSSAFANYTNTTQQLRNSIDQDGQTTEQITNDKANFEQQFLIGASLMAKQKATEAFAGMLKKSKNLSALRGKTEDAIKQLAQSAQDRATSVAKELTNKIPGVQKDITPSGPTELENLISDRDEAEATRDATQRAGAELDEKLGQSREELSAAKEAVESGDLEKTFAEDTAQFMRGNANADKVLQTAAEQARNAVPKTRTKDDDPENLRTEPNPDYDEVANKATQAQEAASRSESAAQAAEDTRDAAQAAAAGQQAALETATAKNAAQEAERSALSDTLAEHTATANEAANAVKTAQQATSGESKLQDAAKLAEKTLQPAGDEAAQAAAAAAAKGANNIGKAAEEAEKLAKLEKAAQAAKDTEEAAAASSEGDGPLGLLVAAAAAAATQFIGRKIKAHENIAVGGVGAGVIPKLNFSSTLGA